MRGRIFFFIADGTVESNFLEDGLELVKLPSFEFFFIHKTPLKQVTDMLMERTDVY